MASVRFEYEGQISSGANSWDNDSNKRVIISLDDNDLTVNELLEEFMNFMKAIGYSFELGDRLDIVNDFKEIKTPETHVGYGAVPPQPIVDESGGVIGVAYPSATAKDPY